MAPPNAKPERNRMMLRLSMRGYNCKQIATVYGCSSNNVFVIVRREGNKILQPLRDAYLSGVGYNLTLSELRKYKNYIIGELLQ